MNESVSQSASADFEWRWKAFAELTTREVYDLLNARSAVFVVEQQCTYVDIDGLDLPAWHLLAYGRARDGAPLELAGYLRVLLPDGNADDEHGRDAIRIGRVLTTAPFRGTGLGRRLLATTLAHVARQWPGVPLSLHAQAHLQHFYGGFGFAPSSDVHDDAGIPHIWMSRGPADADKSTKRAPAA